MNAALRRLVRERASHYCEYCLLLEAVLPVRHHIDHIVAQRHLGDTSSENLALACYRCNVQKLSNLAGIDPETKLTTVLFHPRQHVWNEYFALVGTRVVGKTPVGRATVQLLDMNDSH